MTHEWIEKKTEDGHIDSFNSPDKNHCDPSQSYVKNRYRCDVFNCDDRRDSIIIALDI
jgi:hypothetical protein